MVHARSLKLVTCSTTVLSISTGAMYMSAGLELNLFLVPASRAGYYIFGPAHQPICLPQHILAKNNSSIILNTSTDLQFHPSTVFHAFTLNTGVALHSLSHDDKA